MAIRLGAICLDEPVNVHMAKTVGYVIVGDLTVLGSRLGEPLASRNKGKLRRAPDRQKYEIDR